MSNYFTDTATAKGTEKPIKPAKVKTRNMPAVLGWALKNTALIISAILLLVTGFTLFVATFDLTGSSIQENTLSATTLFIATVSYILFINGFTVGEDLTENSAAVKDIYVKYYEKLWYLRENNLMNELDKFIKEYCERELKISRENILLCANLTLEDYDAILAGNFRPLTKAEQKAVDRAQKLKPINLTRQMVLNVSAENERRNPIKSKRLIQFHKHLRFGVKLISTIFKTVFIVSITINLLMHRDLETVVHSLLVFSLVILSFLGGLAGGRRIKLEYSERTQDILNFFDEFFDWKKEKN